MERAPRRAVRQRARLPAGFPRPSARRARLFPRDHPLRGEGVPQLRDELLRSRQRKAAGELPLLHREQGRAQRPRLLLLEHRRPLPHRAALRGEGRRGGRQACAGSGGRVQGDGVRLLLRHVAARRRGMRRHEDVARVRKRKPPRPAQFRAVAARTARCASCAAARGS